MAGIQRLLAIAMTFLSAGVPSGGKLEVVGVVVQANHASLGSQSASEGTTIYDGDRLSTDAEGTLRLLIGGAVLHLGDKSSVMVHDKSSGGTKNFEAELFSGTAVLSVTAVNAGEIVAYAAHVRPVSEMRGVVRVRTVGPHEVIVYAERGAAQISYRGETEMIPEGKAYRVLLNDSDGGARDGSIAKTPAHLGKMLVVVAVAAGAATAIGVTLAVTGKQSAVESPDKP